MDPTEPLNTGRVAATDVRSAAEARDHSVKEAAHPSVAPTVAAITTHNTSTTTAIASAISSVLLPLDASLAMQIQNKQNAIDTLPADPINDGYREQLKREMEQLQAEFADAQRQCQTPGSVSSRPTSAATSSRPASAAAANPSLTPQQFIQPSAQSALPPGLQPQYYAYVPEPPALPPGPVQPYFPDFRSRILPEPLTEAAQFERYERESAAEADNALHEARKGSNRRSRYDEKGYVGIPTEQSAEPRQPKRKRYRDPMSVFDWDPRYRKKKNKHQRSPSGSGRRPESKQELPPSTVKFEAAAAQPSSSRRASKRPRSRTRSRSPRRHRSSRARRESSRRPSRKSSRRRTRSRSRKSDRRDKDSRRSKSKHKHRKYRSSTSSSSSDSTVTSSTRTKSSKSSKTAKSSVRSPPPPGVAMQKGDSDSSGSSRTKRKKQMRAVLAKQKPASPGDHRRLAQQSQQEEEARTEPAAVANPPEQSSAVEPQAAAHTEAAAAHTEAAAAQQAPPTDGARQPPEVLSGAAPLHVETGSSENASVNVDEISPVDPIANAVANYVGSKMAACAVEPQRPVTPMLPVVTCEAGVNVTTLVEPTMIRFDHASTQSGPWPEQPFTLGAHRFPNMLLPYLINCAHVATTERTSDPNTHIRLFLAHMMQIGTDAQQILNHAYDSKLVKFDFQKMGCTQQEFELQLRSFIPSPDRMPTDLPLELRKMMPEIFGKDGNDYSLVIADRFYTLQPLEAAWFEQQRPSVRVSTRAYRASSVEVTPTEPEHDTSDKMNDSEDQHDNAEPIAVDENADGADIIPPVPDVGANAVVPANVPTVEPSVVVHTPEEEEEETAKRAAIRDKVNRTFEFDQNLNSILRQYNDEIDNRNIRNREKAWATANIELKKSLQQSTAAVPQSEPPAAELLSLVDNTDAAATPTRTTRSRSRSRSKRPADAPAGTPEPPHKKPPPDSTKRTARIQTGQPAESAKAALVRTQEKVARIKARETKAKAKAEAQAKARAKAEAKAKVAAEKVAAAAEKAAAAEAKAAAAAAEKEAKKKQKQSGTAATPKSGKLAAIAKGPVFSDKLLKTMAASSSSKTARFATLRLAQLEKIRQNKLLDSADNTDSDPQDFVNTPQASGTTPAQLKDKKQPPSKSPPPNK